MAKSSSSNARLTSSAKLRSHWRGCKVPRKKVDLKEAKSTAFSSATTNGAELYLENSRTALTTAKSRGSSSCIASMRGPWTIGANSLSCTKGTGRLGRFSWHGNQNRLTQKRTGGLFLLFFAHYLVALAIPNYAAYLL